MKRIVVIGSGGSGKSTFSQRLGEVTGLPVVHLDKLYWHPGWVKTPREEWIEVPVPALVSEEMFALAQEQLEKNKQHSPRRTVEPTLLQGMLVCEQCGYGLYRTSTHTSKHKLNYYRCIGSDGYRRLNGPLCTNRPIRQDYLDQFVWSEIIRLLDDPALIQTEIDRRREAARNADPLRKREEE
jgi:site-specific DNA recombinase